MYVLIELNVLIAILKFQRIEIRWGNKLKYRKWMEGDFTDNCVSSHEIITSVLNINKKYVYNNEEHCDSFGRPD